MSGLGDLFDWASASATPGWVSVLMLILIYVLAVGVLAISFAGIYYGYGWLVFGVWVAIPSYALLEGYRRSQK